MNRAIQFIHIPKCGGMSLNAAFTALLGAERCKIYYGNEEQKALWQVRWDRSEWDFQGEYLDFRQCLLQTYLLRGYAYIGGHLPYSPLAENYYKERCDFITLLRDPVQRYQSHLIHLVFQKGKYSPGQYNSGIADPLEEIRSYHENRDFAEVMANQISLALGGLGYRCKPEIENREGQAIEALRHLRVVGFTDEMDTFAGRLRDQYGPDLVIPRINETRGVLTNPELAQRIDRYFDSIRDEVRELCRIDQAVFDEARRAYAG